MNTMHNMRNDMHNHGNPIRSQFGPRLPFPSNARSCGVSEPGRPEPLRLLLQRLGRSLDFQGLACSVQAAAAAAGPRTPVGP